MFFGEFDSDDPQAMTPTTAAAKNITTGTIGCLKCIYSLNWK
ncbi:hypothetical protein AKJ09_01019 [Labilithrix luteola]|uniref:Uncharacterized protein n=1 Tax=Labilithrix luteola TaxID=1391654 RepID=A0A0K1PLF0_9BACT|nr:hypothetical protein AKJ09_01019 [Labilithrix luteola]